MKIKALAEHKRTGGSHTPRSRVASPPEQRRPRGAFSVGAGAASAINEELNSLFDSLNKLYYQDRGAQEENHRLGVRRFCPNVSSERRVAQYYNSKSNRHRLINAISEIIMQQARINGSHSMGERITGHVSQTESIVTDGGVAVGETNDGTSEGSGNEGKNDGGSGAVQAAGSLKTLLEIDSTAHLTVLYTIAILERREVEQIYVVPIRDALETMTDVRWERHNIHHSMTTLFEKGFVKKCDTDSKPYHWCLTDEGWAFLEKSGTLGRVERVAENWGEL